MKEPWWYTRQMLQKNATYIKGTTLDLGAGMAKYKTIIEPNCDNYYAMDIVANKNIDFIGDALNVPIKNDSFDTVICNQVIEHVPKPWKLIEEIYRILKKDGTLLLSGPWIATYHAHPNDYYRFSSEGLAFLLHNAGFSKIEIQAQGGDCAMLTEYIRTKLEKGIFKRIIVFSLELLTRILEKEGRNYIDTSNHFVVAHK
ncbi:class I SAM-dependent methyltransferase [Chloroflexota bacterium]